MSLATQKIDWRIVASGDSCLVVEIRTAPAAGRIDPVLASQWAGAAATALRPAGLAGGGCGDGGAPSRAAGGDGCGAGDGDRRGALSAAGAAIVGAAGREQLSGGRACGRCAAGAARMARGAGRARGRVVEVAVW